MQGRTGRQIWIGLAHVRPDQGNDLLEGALGALVPVVALALGVDNFTTTVTTLLNSYSFEVVKIDDIQLFDERREQMEVVEDIKRLAKGLTETEPIALDTFQTYENE